MTGVIFQLVAFSTASFIAQSNAAGRDSNGPITKDSPSRSFTCITAHCMLMLLVVFEWCHFGDLAVLHWSVACGSRVRYDVARRVRGVMGIVVRAARYSHPKSLV